MPNKYLLVGAGCAGLLLAYLAYKGAGRAVDLVIDTAGDAAQAVNPFNNQNVFNKGVTGVYQAVSPNNGTIGTDIYDLWHLGRHPTNEQVRAAGMGASTMTDFYQWATGSDSNIINDFNTWWEGITK